MERRQAVRPQYIYARIAECGNGGENGGPDSLRRSESGDKGNHIKARSDHLHRKGPPHDLVEKSEQIVHVFQVHRVAQHQALTEGKALAGQHHQCRYRSDHAYTADLDEKKDHNLSEMTPVLVSILHYEPCYANRCGRRKQRICKGSPVPRS